LEETFEFQGIPVSAPVIGPPPTGGFGTAGVNAGSILGGVFHAIPGQVVNEPVLSYVTGRSAPRIYIETVYPSVDGGRFAIKRIVGEPVDVWADIFRDGHALLAADLIWRKEGAQQWQRVAMRLDSNDRWT